MDPAAVRRSYADAEPRSFWLAQPGAPDPGDPLEGNREADLVVVGGGLTGLWAALLAKADRREGRGGPWLRTLDRLGMGFDS